MTTIDTRAPKHIGKRVLLLLWSLAWACAARPDALPLWEIDGTSNHIMLLGSIHLLRPGDQLPTDILEAYRHSDVLIMEMDLDSLDPLQAQESMQRLGMDPNGRTLEQQLGTNDYNTAARKARDFGFDITILQPFRPWLAAMTITQVRMQQLGFDPESGVEQQLLGEARRDHKEIRGLETLDQQLSALTSLSPKAQRDFLMQTLDDAATMGRDVDQIVGAWKSGNTRALEDEFLRGMKDQRELYQNVVVQRNRNWLRAITPMTKDRQNYFIVVGVLHLVGRDGLIRMLEDSGYHVHQVARKTAASD